MYNYGNYGYGQVDYDPCCGYCNTPAYGYGCYGGGNNYALILVLFILLVIIGCSCWFGGPNH